MSDIIALNRTTLSPKDLQHYVSLRIRIFVFLSAWFTVLWFSIAPWFSTLQLACGVMLLPFQIYWIYLMIWVNRWCMSGISQCRERFTVAMNVLRYDPLGHRILRDTEIIHWVCLCNYKEDLSVIRASLNALSLQSIGAHRICVLMACEGAENDALEKIMPLAAEFLEFRKFVVNVHFLQPGEFAGKSANCSSAFRSLCAGAFHDTKDERLQSMSGELDNDYKHWHESPDVRSSDREPYSALLERGMLTVMDADSLFHPFHFYALDQSYHCERHSTRDQTIWQAPVCNFMNLYSIPAPSRLMSMVVTLHEMASLMHPTCQKLPFSTYTMTASLALHMGGWACDVLCDDWHCYERVFFATRGNCYIVPTHYPILCYGAEEDTWWKSAKARFTQAKRHSWAAIETSCLFAFWRGTAEDQRPALLDFLSVLRKMFMLHFLSLFQTPMVICGAIFQVISMLNGYNLLVVPSVFTSVDYNLFGWIILWLVTVLFALVPLIAVASWYITVQYEQLIHDQYRKAVNWMSLGNLATRVCCVESTAVECRDSSLAAAIGRDDNKTYTLVKTRKSKKARKRHRDDILLNDVDDNVEFVDAIDDVTSVYRTPEIPNDTFGYDRQPPPILGAVQKYIDEYLVMPRSTLFQRCKLLFEVLVILPFASFVYGFMPALITQSMLPFKRYYKFLVAAKPRKIYSNAAASEV